ncbi:hypothetical protein [Pantoea agglomerans]|uniref:hypothetical protein n=1 Tax=Enterobacter agglomerans TaxID=549 RepID=UPI002892E95E|nr:hypothetical protein [Pantoea agglomerans]WNK30361.1 hypothetical protein RM157_17815 [Pantoea agglomerans]
MKNNVYTINDLYRMIRDLYMDSFPHTLSFDALNALNVGIKYFNKSAKVEVSNMSYCFNNPNPTLVDSENPFTNENGTFERKREEYFEKAASSEIRNIIQDLQGLESWLCTAGYIQNKIATEKMLANKKIL